jgi:hypothetical protein
MMQSRMLPSCCASAALALLLSSFVAACGDDDDGHRPGDAGAGTGGPEAGSGGRAGRNSVAGRGGNGASGGAGAPAAGRGGPAGQGGKSGHAGSSGTAGQAGSGDEADGGTPPEAGAGGTGGAGGSVPIDPSIPLLERTPRSTYTCTLSSPAAKLNLNPWAGGVPLTAAGTSYLAWVDGTDSSRVAWSTLGHDGTLGTATPVYSVTNGSAFQLAAAAGSDRFTLAWSETGNTDQRIALTQVGSGGNVLTAHHFAPGNTGANTTNEQRGPRVVASGTGYGLLWTETTRSTTSTEDATTRLRFALLDAASAVAGSAKTLIDGPKAIDTHDLIATANGFAAIYSSFSESTGWVTQYRALDAQGANVGSVIDLSTGAPREGGGALLARGSDVLVAWSEWSASTQDSESAVIHVARFDATGQRAGDTYVVQASTNDQQNLGPRWVDMGSHVGLVWGQGTVIYICAGCVPDDHLRFVVLDGADLTPASAVIDMASPVIKGGLTQASTVLNGDALLVLSSITYHTSAEAAAATIACTK